MVLLAPSLLSSDFSCFGETVSAFERARGAERPDLLHFDLMDGHFVPNLTFGTGLLSALRDRTTIPFDVHLMVENAENYIAACGGAGAERVAVHCESTKHLPRLLNEIHDCDMLAGVALNPATSLDAIAWVVETMDYLLLMGVNPGFSGQQFIPSTLAKLRDARAMLPESCAICVDGGVSFHNARALYQAGADILVAGSSLFVEPATARSDYKGVLSMLGNLRTASVNTTAAAS